MTTCSTYSSMGKKRGFKVGDRVIYIFTTAYLPSEQHPMQGTQYACLGTIVPMEHPAATYSKIRWDNEHIQLYLHTHIRHVFAEKINDPNRAFKVAKSKVKEKKRRPFEEPEWLSDLETAKLLEGRIRGGVMWTKDSKVG